MELFFNIVGCCNFTRAKSHEVCTVLLDKGILLKNRTTVAAKHSVWLLSMLKTVDLESVCRSQLLGWSDFGSEVYKV